MRVMPVDEFEEEVCIRHPSHIVEKVHCDVSAVGTHKVHSLRIKGMGEDETESKMVEIMLADIPPVAVARGDIVYVDTNIASKNPGYDFTSSKLANRTTGKAYIGV